MCRRGRQGLLHKAGSSNGTEKNKDKAQLNVDFTITTLHERREYRLREKVQRIRGSVEYEELYDLQWIQGIAKTTDALTKHNLP